MRERVDLSVRPTAEQLQRFRSLTPTDRYAWLANLLQTMHALASAETKTQWRALKQAQSGGFLSVACTFADALDHADFDDAARCLSPDCTYGLGNDVLSGVESIIRTYRDNHDWATRSIERVRYRSHIEGIAPGSARITFEDRVEHRGVSHVYRCEQDVNIGRSRLIERIVHRELPGERAALDAFLAQAGLRG